MPENTTAGPGRPGTAYCRFCGRPDATTRWERGVEIYDSHARNGSVVTCYSSKNQPVVPPKVQR